MNEETIISEGGLTRREMLKKSALVGAVAWAAPVVSSFSTPAFAQVGTVSPASCTSWNCGDVFDICGTPPGPGPDPNICVCDVDTEGNSVCWRNFFCSEPNAIACTNSGQCEPGWRCTTSCCGQTCVPECGTTIASTVTQGGLTGAG